MVMYVTVVYFKSGTVHSLSMYHFFSLFVAQNINSIFWSVEELV